MKKIILLFLIAFSFAIAQKKEVVNIKECLVVKTFDVLQRSPFTSDPIENMIVKGTWKAPAENDSIVSAKDKSVWKKIVSDEKGWFNDQSLNGGYAFVSIDSPKDEIVLLEGMGHNLVYVNGMIRGGNRYQWKEQYESWEPHWDFHLIPVKLNKGRNELLFNCSYGTLKVNIHKNSEGVFLNVKDATMPDLLKGEKIDFYGAVVVINSTGKAITNLQMNVSSEFGINSKTELPIIQPMSVRKVPFQITGKYADSVKNIILKLTLTESGSSKVADKSELTISVKEPLANHKRTYVSPVDGSVQYYSVNPASVNDGKPKALFLSAHGASVEAFNQSASYYPKSWGHIVSPTNRRPYGFNWEDWGRMDALDVYDIAIKTMNIDPSRIYLTGHSMGGHGTWIIGGTYPDKFAALGPSAGWISYWSYRFRDGDKLADQTEMEKFVMRASSPSFTFDLIDNYKQLGLYILHGDIDDNVPPQQSRSMVEKLKSVHNDFVYFEQKGANHWWDNSDDEGADCVDWKPMFDFFARHARPEKDKILELDFTTANPGISSRNYWLTIEAQEKLLELSKINIRLDKGANRFVGKTQNVFRMTLDLDVINKSKHLTIILDGETLSNIKVAEKDKRIWLEKYLGKWKIASDPGYAVKGPHRYGIFKDAFKNNMIFVYGTNGTSSINQMMFNKARYDAEQFWIQGNGSVDVMSDKEFDKINYKDRGVILYGNMDLNSVWNKLLGSSPIQVKNGKVVIGSKEMIGDDLACLFIRPNLNNNFASIGAVAFTGLKGLKLTERRPYLYGGYQYPDVFVFDSSFTEMGSEGVRFTGYFGLNWSLKNGEFKYSKWSLNPGESFIND